MTRTPASTAGPEFSPNGLAVDMAQSTCGHTAPDISIIIVGWRRAPRLATCLASIAAHVPATLACEVIVVLNEPTCELRAELASIATTACIRILRFQANLGFSGAVNQGAAAARGRYFALLNDDCVVQAGWLEELLATFAAHPSCGIVGGTLLNEDGTLQEAGSVIWPDGSTRAIGYAAQPPYSEFARRVEYCSAASLLVRREVWDTLGGLSDAYYPAYYEDVDFCLNAAARGWEVWYQPLSRAVHAQSASTTCLLKEFLVTRNRTIFNERWAAHLATCSAGRDIEEAMWLGMGRPIRVLVIDDEVPDPGRGSGSGRMCDVLTTLAADSGLHVAFHARNPSPADPATFTGLGIRVIQDLTVHMADARVHYDSIVVSRPHNGRIFWKALKERFPTARIIYDAEALYYRRIEAQGMLAATGEERDTLAFRAAVAEAEERALARRADHIVCISAEEAGAFSEWTTTPVTVVEPWLRQYDVGPATFDQRRDVAFVAAWLAGPNSPNADGLRWLLRDVWPAVTRVAADARLLITGEAPPADLLEYAGPDIVYTGRIDDLGAFYGRIRVAVAPIRFGAGVKLKTVEAIQHGVPVVATSEGAAGLGCPGVGTVRVADNARGFAAALVDLLCNREAWEQVRNAQVRTNWAARAQNSGVGLWPQIVRETLGLHTTRMLAR